MRISSVCWRGALGLVAACGRVPANAPARSIVTEVSVEKKEKRDRGMALGTRLGGPSFSKVVETLREVDPELADSLVADAYGGVLSRPGLALAERELSIIAALACQGSLPQLKWHIAAALRIEVEPEAIREVLIQVIPYAGWPSALNALAAMKEVFDENGAKVGRLEQAAPAERRERGLKNGAAVYRDYAGVERTLAEYDPELPGYLTENAYGQIYDRPGLSLRQRELIAVSMLATLQRWPQLAWHIEGAHRVGATPDETKEVIVTLLLYSGWPTVLNALEQWKRVRAGSLQP
jgi:4-carboxymuconolactone decarboxylase